jgi:hypothetical protein
MFGARAAPACFRPDVDLESMTARVAPRIHLGRKVGDPLLPLAHPRGPGKRRNHWRRDRSACRRPASPAACRSGSRLQAGDPAHCTAATNSDDFSCAIRPTISQAPPLRCGVPMRSDTGCRGRGPPSRGRRHRGIAASAKCLACEAKRTATRAHLAEPRRSETACCCATWTVVTVGLHG